ncbi:MAG TPA: aldehyde dehydrogenase, partial [Elusimicrobiales bacterium]|nr:aldehyde dehydrogenase [Elusimicrobiales bacterium]
MTQDDITRIVSEVMKKLDSNPGFRAALQAQPQAAPQQPQSSGGGVYPTVSQAVDAAEKAQHVFQELGIEARKKIIDAIRQASVQNAERFAKMAQEETGMGRWQDKVQKNLICALKTPGVEDLCARAYTGDKGLTLVEYSPFGVVAAITPSTNPVATIISNSIGILSAGNSVVFSPHPASKKCVQEAVRVLNAAAVSAGAPPDLMTTIASPTQESTKELLAHPKTRLNLVTGGPAIVRVAMTTGKTCKVIAAGPGNPPVVVDETAVFPDCAESIITGCGFDNNVLCIAEKEVIVVEAAREKFLKSMRGDKRAYELTGEQMDQLSKLAILEYEPGKEARVNRDFVGKNPSHIAKAIGLSLSDEIRVLWSVVPNDHPFV